jgi:hypothetical protein
MDFLVDLELLNNFYWQSPILNFRKTCPTVSHTRSQVDMTSTQGILFYFVEIP